MLKIEEPMNNNVIKNEPEKLSTEEHSVLPKNKNVFNSIVKTVGKVLPQKWNKKKVKCSSLWCTIICIVYNGVISIFLSVYVIIV